MCIYTHLRACLTNVHEQGVHKQSSVYEHHLNPNTNTLTKIDKPEVALVTPYVVINVDMVLLMQPICSTDLTYMNIYKNTRTSIHIHRKAQGRARASPMNMCIFDMYMYSFGYFCIRYYIHVYQVYRAHGLH